MSEPVPLNEQIPALAAGRKAWLERCGLPTEAEVIAEIRHTLDAIRRGDALEHRVTLALLGMDLHVLRGGEPVGDYDYATAMSWGNERSMSGEELAALAESPTVRLRSAVWWASMCSRGTKLGASDFISKMEEHHAATVAGWIVRPIPRPFDVAEFYSRKTAWSRETIGPRQRVAGVVRHLRKELVELQGAIASSKQPAIREELADICLLAIDLSWRAGGCAAELAPMSGDAIEPAAAAEYIEERLKVADVLANVSEREAHRDVWEHAFRAEAALLWGYAFRALGCDAAPILAKYEQLQARTWPDWRTVPADQPIEHVRATIEDAAATGAMAAGGGDLDAACGAPPTAAPVHRPAMTTRGWEICAGEELIDLGTAAKRMDDMTAEVAKLRAAANKSVTLAEETRRVLDASFGETAACAATRVMDEMETLRAELANSRACVTALNAALLETREVLGAKNDALTTAEAAGLVVRELMAGRSKLAAAHAERTADLDRALADLDTARAEVDRHGQRAGQLALAIDVLKAERTEWRADNESLREERRRVRETLGAAPDETALCAARRMDRQRLIFEKCRDALRLLLGSLGAS